MAMDDEKIIGDDERDKPGEWLTLMFDGASNAMGHGIGVVMMSPKDHHSPFTIKLYFDCTNNIGEYEACIMGIEATIDLRIKILELYEDSSMVINQIRGD